ncbi:MAG: SpoIVB peptidase [Clostridia bacterium]|nr:SpoIVB peptidase [Clostridia bacterium]
MKRNKAIILIFFLFVIFLYVCNITNIPSRVILMNNEKLRINTLIGLDVKTNYDDVIETWKSGEVETSNMTVSLLGTIPVKEVSVTRLPEINVVPLGNLIGLRMYTKGVLVVGMSEIQSEDNKAVKPYEGSSIKEGDTIVEINDYKIDSIETLRDVVNSSDGNDLIIKYERDGTLLTSTITPVKSDDEYKIGLWVRDSATGVGTISFYVPETGQFAALGHGILDVDTGDLIDIESGELVTSKVINIDKAKVGEPGEIRGSISSGSFLGEVNSNTDFGIYGDLSNLSSFNVDVNNSVEVATRDEIEIGDAVILCDLDGNGVEEYKIEVQNLELNNNYDNKSMKIKVVDDRLMEKTGGIICGMSGSPILQNGKLIGVVTNVLVSNPEVGYGVFADLMIKEMMK